MRAVALALTLALATPAAALEEGDRRAVESVIQGQLEAFLRDDGASAYGFAAPSIQRMFPGEAVFMEMVRRGYPPVYRPKGWGFAEVREDGAAVAQAVRLTDADGALWIALYTLEKQPDGSWKISGCTLLRSPEEAA